jgi:hypothetical protein
VLINSTLGNGIDPIVLSYVHDRDASLLAVGGESAFTFSEDPSLNSDIFAAGATDVQLNGALMYTAGGAPFLISGFVFPILGGRTYYLGFGKNQLPGFAQLIFEDNVS